MPIESPSRNLIGNRLKEARKKVRPKVTQLDLIARLETKGIHLEATAVSEIEAKTHPVTDIELVGIVLEIPIKAYIDVYNSKDHDVVNA